MCVVSIALPRCIEGEQLLIGLGSVQLIRTQPDFIGFWRVLVVASLRYAYFKSTFHMRNSFQNILQMFIILIWL